MQVFELHFNPKLKEDLIFDSFCYTPTNVYEKRLGSLYLVGELKNALPQNDRFLDNLARVIKSQFYSTPIKSVEESLKVSLKKANEFLEEEVRKDNTSWLRNLNFAVISSKNFDLNFTKVGDLKIFLLRGGEIIDLGKKLELQEIEPYPLKIFLNIVSGKLTTDDIIFISNKEIFEHFAKENLISEIAKTQIERKFSDKELKKILQDKEKILAQISGICLLISLKPEVLPKKAISFEREIGAFPIRKFFQPIFVKIKSFSRFIKLPKLTIKKPKFGEGLKKMVPKKPEIKPRGEISLLRGKIFPRINFRKFFKKITTLPEIKFQKELKRKLILILTLIIFLIFGFFIFQREKEISLKEKQKVIGEVQEKIGLAENFLILKDAEKANEILKEAWQKILPLTQEKNAVKNEAQTLREKIEENLYNLNKLEKIETPGILFEFSEKEFLPQKMAGIDKVLYFFNPYYNWLFKFEGDEKTKIEIDQKINFGTTFGENLILFFSKPNKLISFKDNQLKESFSLKEPYPNFEFNGFSTFKQSLYFLDSTKGEILKYSFPPDSPQFWLDPNAKKVLGAKSIVIDGSIWVLTEDNKIDRYFSGRYQETLTLNIFPEAKNFEKIFASYNLPYLFIMESAQKRIVILDKEGKIISQFQSEKFDNLKDFFISDKTIYLLNGQKIYQIKF